jgi:hypothetical protein
MARSIEGFACLALAGGCAARALTLAAAAANIRQQICAPLFPAEQSKLDFTLLNAWEVLSESEGKDAWARGCDMTLERAVEFSLEKV